MDEPCLIQGHDVRRDEVEFCRRFFGEIEFTLETGEGDGSADEGRIVSNHDSGESSNKAIHVNPPAVYLWRSRSVFNTSELRHGVRE